MAKVDMTGQVAVVGHRSFIAQELMEQFRGYPVTVLAKDQLFRDFSGFDCVYLILGNARPVEWQEEKERGELASFLMNPRKPRRFVYLSSMALTPHKQECERMIRDHSGVTSVVLRPPAVFGPKQDHYSPMLIPQIERSQGKLVLDRPDLPAWFISVRALAEHMARFADPNYWDEHRCGQPESMAVIPGSFCVTPRNVLDLYQAFQGLESQRIWARDY